VDLQPWQQVSKSLGQTGDDGVLGGPGFEGFEDGVESKACMGSNPNLSDIGRYVREASVEQFDAAVPGAGIARTQFGIPQLGRVSFDA